MAPFPVTVTTRIITFLVFPYWEDTKKCDLFETVTAWKVDRAFLKALVEPFSPSEGPMRPFNLAHLGSASLLSGGPVPKKLERLATAFRKSRWEMNHIRIGRPTGKGRRRLSEENHTWGKPKLNIYVALTWPIRPHDMSTSCEGPTQGPSAGLFCVCPFASTVWEAR